VKTVNLAVAFLLELCMLAALGYWGFQTGGSVPLNIILGIGAPLIAILIWARFMAPTSAHRLTGSAYLLVKLILFGLAAIGLAVAGQVTLAILFGVISVINKALLLAWKQDTPPATA